MKFIKSLFALMLLITPLMGIEDLYEIKEKNEKINDVIDLIFNQLNKNYSCENLDRCFWNLKENYPVGNSDETIVKYIFEDIRGLGFESDTFKLTDFNSTKTNLTNIWNDIEETYLEDENNIIEIIFDDGHGYEKMYHIKNKLDHVYGRILKKDNHFRHYEIRKNYVLHNFNPTPTLWNFYTITEELERDISGCEFHWTFQNQTR